MLIAILVPNNIVIVNAIQKISKFSKKKFTITNRAYERQKENPNIIEKIIEMNTHSMHFVFNDLMFLA